ncbi:MAG: hypothetical protein GX575_30085 [Candidatus Anammoximicrobium sp.]|nr:hypothetical protein [Candidatus Anammoximicrobium sp.]
MSDAPQPVTILSRNIESLAKRLRVLRDAAELDEPATFDRLIGNVLMLLYDALPASHEPRFEEAYTQARGREPVRIGQEYYPNAHVAATDRANDLLTELWLLLDGDGYSAAMAQQRVSLDICAPVLAPELPSELIRDRWPECRTIAQAWFSEHPEIAALPALIVQERTLLPVSGDRPRNPRVGGADEDETRIPVCQSKAVKLFGPGEQPEVNGKKKTTLTKARYDAIKALVQAGENGLTKDELVKKSQHGDAVNSLKNLAKKDRDWERVLQFAGGTGKRHRIK